MIFTETELKGAYIIDLERREDDRGFFARTWCQNEFEAHGLVARIVQANTSYNKLKGTLRGMHYQRAPYAETKLVRAVRGAIVDVIVDLRPDSPTVSRPSRIIPTSPTRSRPSTRRAPRAVRATTTRPSTSSGPSRSA
jgi:dTDP-4-dehydrorhamnose 3,5-epimerase